MIFTMKKDLMRRRRVAMDGVFGNQGFTIAVATCMGVVCFLLLLALYFIMVTRRDMRYWKDQSQAKVTVLGKIDGHLENMETLMREEKPSVLVMGPEQDHLVEEIAEIENDGEREADRPQSQNCMMGKSGRIYTQEEIEVQIRD